ncbi:MAG: tRNA (adenosine(37)-N6)-threonylcarbamoyltransferase complex dimerization subunit type 1 TsaB [Armatimonadota bacterium]|nr:tRNA (adenosine(37)-N6)-threonylcarbamoyltransferase complex dimerization subunit type 1 TsaB [Armatimonadota bacterium]
MRVLAIETSTGQGSVALLDEHGLVAETLAPAPGAHLEWLAGAIVHLLRAHDVPPAAVDGLAVSTGPGSFTGVRVGVVTAIAWAEARGVPVIGVPTLEAIAAGVAAEALPARLVLAAVDVRRGEVAAALFALDGGIRRLSPDLVVPPAALPAVLPARDGPVALAGDALERYRDVLLAAIGPGATVAARSLWWPRARVVGQVGRARLLAGVRVDPARVQPVYPRRAVAGPGEGQEAVAAGQNAGGGSRGGACAPGP